MIPGVPNLFYTQRNDAKGIRPMSRHDLIIREVTVFDGTGAARFTADVGVTGDRIAAVGDLGAASADREIAASGKAVDRKSVV